MNVVTRQHPDGIEIIEFDRREFLEDIWDYKPGDRLSIIGPSEAGKTFLSYQLLDYTATQELPAVLLVMKPDDETVEEWDRRLGFRRIKSWPPPPVPMQSKKPRGWTLWPPHDLKDFAGTNLRMYQEFRKAFIGVYGHRKTRWGRKLDGMVLFADELAGLDDELGMELEIKMMYSRGRSMKAGIWGATQRPVDVPRLAYSSANHLFLAYMPDEGDRKRFGEIGGGIDSKMIDQICLRLPQYWWLYVRRSDRSLCIVRA
jgi:hypothetical protein